MISDRLKRFLVRVSEKLARRWYEGPECPERIPALARAFAVTHPAATRGEWLAMAEELAREAYRSGFRRGFENAERDPSEPDPAPEVVADFLDPRWRERAHDWTWATDLPAPAGLDLVPEDDGGIEEGDDQKALFGRD